MKYKTQELNLEVRNWNLKVLNLERNARHKDELVQQEFL